jgi:hypothetical protein
VTRLYSHTGEAAAASAVNGLPAVIGEPPAPALPTADLSRTGRDPLAAFKMKVREIVEAGTSKTWAATRAALLALLA